MSTDVLPTANGKYVLIVTVLLRDYKLAPIILHEGRDNLTTRTDTVEITLDLDQPTRTLFPSSWPDQNPSKLIRILVPNNPRAAPDKRLFDPPTAVVGRVHVPSRAIPRAIAFLTFP